MSEAIDREVLISRGCLYAETIREAYEKYESAIFKTDNKLHMKHFCEKVYERNSRQLYADFYYPVLSTEQQKEFVEGLSEEERQVFGRFDIRAKDIYYKIDLEEMEFLFEITARNWLFSSFYTENKKVLVWGNYNLEFPVFCEDKETLEFYINLAEQCGLECYR